MTTLRNARFSGSWYHPNGIPELQIPEEWIFTDYSGVPNPIDSAPHSAFVRPEVRVLSPDYLPPAEWPVFVSPENTQAVKAFKGYGAWYSSFSQDFVLAAGSYAAIVEVFPDLVDHYDGTVKVWAPDPLSARVRVMVDGQAVTAWTNLLAGSRVTIRLPFATNGGSNIAFEFMLPFPLNNSGLFLSRLDVETTEPIPPDCRGKPREQYERTYHVYYPSATAEQRRTLAQRCADEQTTFGPSFDDAGIGDLDIRNAVCHYVPTARHQEFVDWFALWYPGVNVTFEDTPAEPPPGVLWQRDPLWRDRHFGASTCGLTIGQAGCFITGIAEAQRFYGIRADATPVTVDETATPAGYSACLLTWNAIQTTLGMDITSSGNLESHLDSGKVAMLRVLPESPQHFVLAMRRDGADYIIRDPLHGTEELLSNRYAGVDSFRLLTPQDDPEPPEEPQYTLRSANHIGLHSGFVAAQSWPYIEQSVTNIQKFFSAGDAYQAGVRAPGIVSIWRKFVGNDGITDPISSHAQWLVDQYTAEIVSAAQALGISQETLLDKITAVESLNEMYPTFNVPQLQRAVEFDCYFAQYLYARFGNTLGAVLGCAAVGNPHETEVEYLLPIAESAVTYRGFLGYHAYWAHNETQSFLVRGWPYHAGRWQEWDKVFVAHGLYPRYALGEGGICYAPDGWSFNSGAGWKSCGPFDTYLTDIAEFNNRVKAWNATHGNRCAGIALFCYGQWDWDDFELGDGDVVTLNNWAQGINNTRNYLAQSYNTVDERRVRMNAMYDYLRRARKYLTPEDLKRVICAYELEIQKFEDGAK